jgi:hypothetical protein
MIEWIKSFIPQKDVLMPALVIDPISAKTLPMLDTLFDTDKDKLTDIIMSTKGEPLDRLIKASIARQTVLGHPDEQGLSVATQLLEVVIHNNLFSRPGDRNEEELNDVLAVISLGAKRTILSASITRYNIFK